MAMKSMYDICLVGGCGHAGLPLGLAFANRGKRVVLYDTNKKAVNGINATMVSLYIHAKAFLCVGFLCQMIS